MKHMEFYISTRSLNARVQSMKDVVLILEASHEALSGGKMEHHHSQRLTLHGSVKHVVFSGH